MSRKFVYYGVGRSGGLDPDALAFLTATGITDSTITTAIDALVKDLKSNSLWSKFRYIYPFVGGSATTNKYNLKDPRDLDVAFRLQFFGGITHTVGFNPNGTNGYANTFCVPSGNVTLNSEHLYITSNTNNTPTSSNPADTGTLNSVSQTSLLGISTATNSEQFGSRMNNNFVGVQNLNRIGSYCATKNGNTNLRIFKNSTLVANGTSGGSLPTFYNLIGTLGRSQSGTNTFHFTNQNYTFATYGDGLTDTDVSNLTSIEQAFNTTLGR
jgi:hypothetical protein